MARLAAKLARFHPPPSLRSIIKRKPIEALVGVAFLDALVPEVVSGGYGDGYPVTCALRDTSEVIYMGYQALGLDFGGPPPKKYRVAVKPNSRPGPPPCETWLRYSSVTFLCH